ncbi:hypothetical protein D5F01_LYC20414 [Larimichthys crocea]|uniref:C2H2-type domain-containing protein n=1 Tax=Larimichthys crocea TaxID=215358 RepID=A0A6G0HQC2_LARCR|nr:hypothetical protein D5F01_LYC20414 [Larimichthys crocea]
MKDIFEDDEETDDSSTETNSNSWLHEYEPSPLTSSPCSEEAGEAETAGEAAFQAPRCSVESKKEHLDLSRNKAPSEERVNQSLTGSRADVSNNAIRASNNTCLECGKTFASCSSLKKHDVVHSSNALKSYKSQKDLNQHFLIHPKPKVLLFLCEKRFSSQALLTVHLRHHT